MRSAVLNNNQISSVQRIKSIFSLVKKDKIKIVAFLENNWVCEQVNIDKFIYYKHIRTKQPNRLYQIVLAGEDYDGIYIFSLRGGKVEYSFDEDKFGNSVLKIKSAGNYDAAVFSGGEPTGYKRNEYTDGYGYSIIRMNYHTEEDFKNALIQTGLISEEEYENYAGVNNSVYALHTDRVMFC